MPSSSKTKRDPEVFAFRILDADDRAAFLKLAKSRGISPHDLARTLALAAVRGEMEKQDTLEELANIRDEVRATRRDLSIATRILLEYAGRTKRPEAQKWVQERLNRPLDGPESAAEADETGASEAG